MIDNTLRNSPAYRVAYSMYVALGGDPTTDFDSVEAIYDAIDVLFGKGNNRITVETIAMEIVENGDYNFDDEEVTGYKPVNIKVEVPQKYTDEQVENIRTEAETTGYNNGYGVGINDGYNNGYGVGYAEGDIAGQQTGYTTGYGEGFTAGETEGYNDGYAEGLDDGAEDQKALLEDITITANGVYEKEDGYNKVTVDTKEGYNYTGLGYSDEFIQKIIKYEKGYIEAARKYLETGKFEYSGAYNGLYLISDTPLNGDSTYYTKRMAAFPHIVPDYTFEWTSSSTSSYNNIFHNNQHKSVMLAGKWKLPNYNDSLGFGMDSKIKEIEGLDAPALTENLSFEKTYTLEKLGDINVPALTTSKNLFNACKNLTSIDSLTTSSALTDCEYMFKDCSKLTSVPLFDTSGVTRTSSMFYYCSELTSIPKFNTSNVIYMGDMFHYCYKLTSVPELDCSSVKGLYQMFRNCEALTDFGGWKNLGMQETVETLGGIVTSINGNNNLSYDSLMNIINKLYDRTSAGYSVLTLSFGKNNLSKLSDEEKAIATNKGWTLS